MLPNKLFSITSFNFCHPFSNLRSCPTPKRTLLSLQTLIISFTSEGINDSGFSQKTCFFKLAHKIV